MTDGGLRPGTGPEGARGGRTDVYLAALLILLAVAWRWATLPSIEPGDPLGHWRTVKTLLAGAPFAIHDHQTARVAVYLPALAVQALFGDHPALFYVVPIAMFIVLVAATYKLGAEIFDRKTGFLAALTVIFFPQSVRSGSQLLPGGFEAAWVVLASYFALVRVSGERRGRPVLAALFLFLAYLSKIQAAFYGPGLLLAIWIWTRRRRSLLVFAGTLAGLLAAEALFYALWPRAPWGRLETVIHSPVVDYIPEISSLLELGTRFTILPDAWRWCFYGAVVGLVVAWPRLPSRARALAGIVGSFLAIMTLALRSIDPLMPLIYFAPRFITSIIPFQQLFLSHLLVALAAAAGGWIASRSPRGRAFTRTAIVALGGIGAFLFLAPHATWRDARSRPHPIDELSRRGALMSETLADDGLAVFRYDLESGTDRELYVNSKDLLYHLVLFLSSDTPARVVCLLDESAQVYVVAGDRRLDAATVTRLGDLPGDEPVALFTRASAEGGRWSDAATDAIRDDARRENPLVLSIPDAWYGGYARLHRR